MIPTPLRRTLLTVVLLVSSHASFAGDWSGFASVGPEEHGEVGVGKALGNGLAIRTVLGTRRPSSYHRTLNGVDYGFHPQSMTSLSAIMDWYPMRRSGFRLSGGLGYLDRNEQTLSAASTADGPLTGKVSYSRWEPYMGVGWESAPIDQGGWRFTSDLGLRLGHVQRVTLTAANGEDASAQRQRVESDLGRNNFRLAASIGVAYRF